MENVLSTGLPAILAHYLPIKNLSMNIMISSTIAQLIVLLYIGLKDLILKYVELLNLFNYDNYVIINSENEMYNKLIEYLYLKYKNKVNRCELKEIMNGKYKLLIEKLKNNYIEEKYGIHKIKIKVNKHNKDSIIKREIIISSKSSLQIIEKYIEHIKEKCDINIVKTIKIYKLLITGDKKDRMIKWNKIVTKTNKNKENTIVSDKVNKSFFEDINKFIKDELYFTKRGQPYKKGYLLYGEPGCGKTSLIKVVANEYNLPVFIIDLNLFKSNSELIEAMYKINKFITKDQKYLLIFEDFDRCDICNNYTKITEDCLLNILDGVDENYGRITIITTNYIRKIKNIKSLIRPGRIDSIIKVTYCNSHQIKKIIQLVLDIKRSQKNELIDFNEIIITPAKLVGLCMFVDRITNGKESYNYIINILQKYKDFTVIDLDEIIELHNLIFKEEKKEEKSEKLQSFDKNKIKLEKYNKDIEKMEKKINDNNTKGKLLIDRKKIETKILELNIKKKELLRLKKKRMNTTITTDELTFKEEKDKLLLEKKKINKLILELSMKGNVGLSPIKNSCKLLKN